VSERFDTRETLIQRVRSGRDEAAWEEFSSIYNEYVYLVVRQMGLGHHDALDVVQDVMLVLVKKLPEVRTGEGQPKFRQWLSTVTKNAVRSLLRSAKRRAAREEAAQGADAADQYETIERISLPEIEAIAEREWQKFIYNKAFERLKERFTGNAIAAFESSLDDESAEVTAGRLGIAVDSVYRLRARVKQRLMEEVNLLKLELEP
jgi:RNA polymerase sigma-70 factor (ECF subfamily)